MTDREFDLVLHGASGFVGALVAAQLAAVAPADTRIALSGRDAGRLARVGESIGREWPRLVVDALDDAAVRSLAERSRVVVSTVGPYLKYGLPLVRACAELGTSYADLTGEILFAADSTRHLHAVAQDTGARIVHSCGFDSVPSDLGTWELYSRVTDDGAGTLGQTVFELVSAQGGLSGGTIDSIRAVLDEVRADRDRRRIAFDPYALSPDRAEDPDGRDERDAMHPTRDELLGRWVAPFVMASYNTRIVRRSNALLGHAYGPDFRYREVMSVGRSPLAPLAAAVTSMGIGALAGGLVFGPSRRVLDRVLPKPGAGPPEAKRAGGRFLVRIHTWTSTGARYVATFGALGDPGYAATAVMLGQSGLSLASDPLTSEPGVLTPAVAMGSHLSERLRAQQFTITAGPR